MEFEKYLNLKLESKNNSDKYYVVYNVYNKGTELGRIAINFSEKGIPITIRMHYIASVDGGGDMQGSMPMWRRLELNKNKTYEDLAELLKDLEKSKIKTALLMETEENGAW